MIGNFQDVKPSSYLYILLYGFWFIFFFLEKHKFSSNLCVDFVDEINDYLKSEK